MALDAAGITVDQEMFCDGDFTAKGEVSIAGARLRRLSFRGADLAQSGRMGADIAETLECDRGFKATGQIHLENANIGGALSFCGAELKAEGAEDSDRISLNADLITVGRSVDFGMWVRGGHYERFRSEGEVRVICAHIHGQLECHGAWFKNEGRESLIADGLVVDYDAFLDDGFSARGEVRLVGAHVVGQLSCRDATFTRASRAAHDDWPVALRANGLKVDCDLFLDGGFEAEGEVRLSGAHVGADLKCENGVFDNLMPSNSALNLEHCEIGGVLIIRPKRFVGALILRKSWSDRYVDNVHAGEVSPVYTPSRIEVNGFRYNEIRGVTDDADVDARIAWLKTCSIGTYAPQPYMQLRAYYLDQGDVKSAREVAIEKQRARRSALPSVPGRAWDGFLGWSIAYGYKPWRVAYFLIAAYMISLPYFFMCAQVVNVKVANSRIVDVPYPPLYVADLMIPLVNLHLRDAWIPSGGVAQAWAAILVVIGWLLTTLVVAGLSGIFKKD